ncbi:manganese efflux pump [Clostridium aminobutyricum]|uniref:Manganese efflux pump n=1 Tax=Clostridium aminobutyricum TaxID=33953 RepID=A0A939DAZ1_CLOAM|nr:manganese efflux pump [Clostridium aminobutyricum]MBN7774511.1 manganese efflux pump [Clostridium aminobutyricum]
MYAFFLALSLNIDSLSIGVNYGLRKIKISIPAVLTIIMISLGALTLSYLAGYVVFSFISIFASKIISSFLLMALGFFLFVQTIINIRYPIESEAFIIKKIRIKPLHLIVNIVREPSAADMDHSEVIDMKEAAYIGAALSIDALTVGLSLAAYQINLLGFLLLSAVINSSFLIAGELAGRLAGRFISENKLKLAASLTIILLGLTKLA